MAIPFLTKEKADDLIERLKRIQATDTPKFGTLNPTQLMRHLRHVFEVSLEKVEEKDISNIITRSVVRVLFFHWFTNWPKGKIKAPDSFTPSPEYGFEEERNLLLNAIHEFIEEAEKDPNRKTLSPLLGKCTLEYWRRIHGIHVEHHCKQYDV